MRRAGPTTRVAPRRISLVAVPDATVSTLTGLYDVLNGTQLMRGGGEAPFVAEIVGGMAGPLRLASGIPVEVQRCIDDVDATDVVIVPSLLLPEGGWRKGRYPALVEWLGRMHRRGALLCSACSGVFLLGETGILDGLEATVHFGYAEAFAAAYPTVTIHPDRVLVVSGGREDVVSSGASNTWHDLALYLIARFSGATTAQEIARFFALQWHQDGLRPYIVFEGRTGHGDAEIEAAQAWLTRHFSVANPIGEAVKRSSLSERTFKRRFTAATGLTPLAYVQRLRVEEAKRALERTDVPVDEVSWRVGYEDAAFFRRLFRRTTGMAPGAYRRRFRIPEFARPADSRRGTVRRAPA